MKWKYFFFFFDKFTLPFLAKITEYFALSLKCSDSNNQQQHFVVWQRSIFVLFTSWHTNAQNLGKQLLL